MRVKLIFNLKNILKDYFYFDDFVYKILYPNTFY